jgi:hypothetical protein
MKYLVISYTIALIGMAHAQTTNKTYQDNMGRNVGRSTTDVRGNKTYYDRMGHNTGRSETNGNTTTIYDDKGRQTGTVRWPN